MASLADLASGSPTPARAREPTVFTVTWETCRRKCRTCVALPKVQRGVQTWRPLPTWRQGARWRGRTWRQNVASLAHMASGSHVAPPDVASKLGVRRHRSTWRHRTWRQNVASRSQASRHVSSKCVFSRRTICAPPQATTLLKGLLGCKTLIPKRGVRWQNLKAPKAVLGCD